VAKTDQKLRESICSHIAGLLKEERERQKLSLNHISAKAGLNRQTVTFIEKEDRTPTIDTLLRLTEALGLDLEDVIRNARRLALRSKPLVLSIGHCLHLSAPTF
jgi:transcriptional regulator with XRE-family HTH domain